MTIFDGDDDRTDADRASVRLGYANHADDTDPEGEEERTDDDCDVRPARRWDPMLRGYAPTDGNWPTRQRAGHIRSSQRRGMVIPCGLDPRVGDDNCDAEEGGEDDVDA